MIKLLGLYTISRQECSYLVSRIFMVAYIHNCLGIKILLKHLYTENMIDNLITLLKLAECHKRQNLIKVYIVELYIGYIKVFI